MKKIVDDWTFGGGDAEITLAKILRQIDNEHLTNHVGRILAQVDDQIKNVNVRNGGASLMYKLLRTYFYGVIEKSMWVKNYPEIETYLKNVVTIKLRVYILRKIPKYEKHLSR